MLEGAVEPARSVEVNIIKKKVLKDFAQLLLAVEIDTARTH